MKGITKHLGGVGGLWAQVGQAGVSYNIMAAIELKEKVATDLAIGRFFHNYLSNFHSVHDGK